MVRGKNSGDGLLMNGGDKGDTLNLLDSTDSDVEWLNLPPIKGKKPKKKKSKKTHKDTGCSLWSFMRIFLQLSVLGVVVLLCVVCVWLTSQLNDVRLRMENMESRSSMSIGDLEKLFQQVAGLNRSLDLHGKTLDTLTSNMSSINIQVTQLSGRVDKVMDGLKAAPELKLLPEKLQTVSQSVAAIGADVSGMKETLATVQPFVKSATEKFEELTKQVQDITNKNSDGIATTDNPVINPELENNMLKLSQQMSDVNSTVFTQMSALIKSNGQHEERLTHLEDITKQLSKNMSSLTSDHTSISSEHASISSDHSSINDDYTSDKFKTSVTDIVQDILANESPASSSSKVDGIMANISKVLDNLKGVEAKYKTLETLGEPGDQTSGKYVTLEMFQTLGDGFHAKVEGLNSSFIKLQADVSTMSSLLTKQANTVTNLTYQVEGTKMFLATLQKKIDNSGQSGGTVLVTPSDETKITEKATRLTEPPVEGSPVQPKEITESPKGKPETTTFKPGAVHVDSIKNYDDLELNFLRWDRAGAGQVDYRTLPDYLGPQVPNEEDLKSFDEDHNGLYSLKEFAKAFGFPISATTVNLDITTMPPR